MDQSHPQVADDLSLDRLVADALCQLRKLGDSGRSLRRDRTIWRRLIAFSHQRDMGGAFSEDLAVHFVEAYRIHDDETVGPHEGCCNCH